MATATELVGTVEPTFGCDTDSGIGSSGGDGSSSANTNKNVSHIPIVAPAENASRNPVPKMVRSNSVQKLSSRLDYRHEQTVAKIQTMRRAKYFQEVANGGSRTARTRPGSAARVTNKGNSHGRGYPRFMAEKIANFDSWRAEQLSDMIKDSGVTFKPTVPFFPEPIISSSKE